MSLNDLHLEYKNFINTSIKATKQVHFDMNLY